MASANLLPVPIGVTNSFSNLAANVSSATFGLDAGFEYLVTFQPVDTNNPGSLVLYDSGNNALLTMTNPFVYGTYAMGAAASGYYFKASLGAQLAAITSPSIRY